MSVSPFFPGEKPIESNKNEEESNDSEIEEKSYIKIMKTKKPRSQLRKKVTKLG